MPGPGLHPPTQTGSALGGPDEAPTPGVRVVGGRAGG